MSLTISLPKEKAIARALKLGNSWTGGAIAHKELESVFGKLPFTQTSIFGRVGRAIMTSLYRKVNSHYYAPGLSGRDASTLRCWAMALLNLTPRLTRARAQVDDLIIYTDAATATQIIAAVKIDTRTFRADRALSDVFSRRVGRKWKTLFDPAGEIYGLEMLAIFAIRIGPFADLTGLNIIFFVGNNNSLEGLVSNAPGPPVIAAMAQLIWYRIADLNAAVWFGRVPSTKNIADLSTKLKDLPIPSRHIANFTCLQSAFDLVVAATAAILNGQPVQPLQRN